MKNLKDANTQVTIGGSIKITENKLAINNDGRDMIEKYIVWS